MSKKKTFKKVSRLLLAILFIAAGILHFIKWDFYLKIMPPYLSYPGQLVYISGIFEILGGIGLLIPGLHKIAATGLILLLIAVLPANIHMAVRHEDFQNIPKLLLHLRPFLQPLLAYWLYYSTKSH